MVCSAYACVDRYPSCVEGYGHRVPTATSRVETSREHHGRRRLGCGVPGRLRRGGSRQSTRGRPYRLESIQARGGTCRARRSGLVGDRRARPQLWGRPGGWGTRRAGRRAPTVFGASGPVVRAVAGELRLRLVAVGRGGTWRASRRRLRVASGNTVSYRRPGLEDWYRLGRSGFEQGFAIERRHAGTGWLTIAVRSTGAPRPRAADNGIVFGASGSTRQLSYRGLSAVDATGRHLPTRLALAGMDPSAPRR